MIFVLEATAIAQVFAVRDTTEATERMTELVERDVATFPDDVLRELREHYAGEPAYVWAYGVRGERVEAAVPWNVKQEILDSVPEVLDPDNPREQCGPAVLGLVTVIRDNVSASIVTEDIGDKPGRRSVAQCCDALGLPWMTTHEFLVATGWPI